jgi:hypothetical protein
MNDQTCLTKINDNTNLRTNGVAYILFVLLKKYKGENKKKAAGVKQEGEMGKNKIVGYAVGV